MVMQTPKIKKHIARIKMEIFLLNMKKKLAGALVEADEQRLRELQAQLLIKY